jgi:hypothetical protein
MKKIALTALFFILISCFSFTQALPVQNLSIQDRVIASTFKALAKIYLSAVQEDRLKNAVIKDIDKMDNVKYEKRYADIYSVLKTYPMVVRKYGLTADLSKEMAISRISILSKKDINGLIDDIPDEYLVWQYVQYLKKKGKDESKNQDHLGQVHEVWGRVLYKLNKVNSK